MERVRFVEISRALQRLLTFFDNENNEMPLIICCILNLFAPDFIVSKNEDSNWKLTNYYSVNKYTENLKPLKITRFLSFPLEHCLTHNYTLFSHSFLGPYQFVCVHRCATTLFLFIEKTSLLDSSLWVLNILWCKRTK